MSAQILSSQDFPAPARLAVSFRLILALYLIIPVCVLLQLFDGWFWHDFLKENLPSNTGHFLLYQILFGTPHIVASAILLCSNGDYLKLYKPRIFRMTLALAAVFGIGSLFLPYYVFYVAVAAWTVLHVLKQQHGLARGLCKLPAPHFYGLLGLSVGAGLLIYLGIFLQAKLTPDQVEWIKLIAGNLCVLLALGTVYCQRLVATAFGKWFLWSNTLLVLSSYYLFIQQYYFLAILGPRLVHDATAYFFYVTHDYNRHHQQPQNWLYRQAKSWHVHCFIVLPALSFGLAFVLQAYGDHVISLITNYWFGIEIRKAVTLGVLGYLGLMHYYTESFTWKQDSPYRRYITFSK
ncbi:hypothetical protein [Methylomicrobium lacus]|uniref:hypothetical protein n=1 Tax=Methylomicrobium lacus TaxID=136992 RepID=UPI0035A90983